MAIRYLTDENLIPAYAKQMRRRRSDLVIWTVGEVGAPSLGTLDPEILVWCEEYDFILVTNNRKSMPGHLRDHIALDRHIPGIFLLNPELSIGQNIDELLLIADGSLDGE